MPRFPPEYIERMQKLVDKVKSREVSVQDVVAEMAIRGFQLMPKLLSKPEFKQMSGDFMNKLPRMFERMQSYMAMNQFLRLKEVGLFKVTFDLSAAMRMDFNSAQKFEPMEENELEQAPYIVHFLDDHIIGGAGISFYASSVMEEQQVRHTIVRPGKPYKDPDTDEILGYEAAFIGDADLKRTGDPAKLHIVSSDLEAIIGDRLPY